MDDEVWLRVEQLYHAAMELEENQRKDFLDRECAGDQALRGELESLIAYGRQTGRIIDKPAWDAVVGALAKELHAHNSNYPDSQIVARAAHGRPVEKTLAPETKLGDYEVRSLLGSGGMGQVYRAHDLRLGRDVAIKVLPSLFSADSDRLRRFEQEARAAAALNHPNILAVFQMGTYESAPFLVSELLEGETLRGQIGRGPLSVPKTIDYGAQIARGLAAAQEKNIVHRDLKPENLFITREGRVKILDFGLAKLTEPQPESERSVHTEPGLLMGTVDYMSPEQVRGKPADSRTDIFAFGVILYEMLTGKQAFRKATAADTLSAILNEDPPEISRISNSIPPALQRVVNRCLEKNPEQRFQSASDLGFALEMLREIYVGGESPPKRDPAPPTAINFAKNGRRALAGGLFVLGLLLGAYLHSIRGAHSVDGSSKHKQFTFLGDAHAPAVSPDGLSVAYVSRKFGEPDRLMLQAADGAVLQLARATELDYPRWSPDGSQLLFSKYEPELHRTDRQSAEGLGISVVSRLGGVVRPIVQAGYACWFAADGSQLIAASPREYDSDFKGVRLVNTHTGETKEVRLSDYLELWDIDCSVRAGLILAVTSTSGKFQIRTFASEGGVESKLVETDDRIFSARWSPAGDSIYYLHGSGSTKDLSKVSATGSRAKPTLLYGGLQAGRAFTLSADGHSLAYTREERHWNLWQFDLAPPGKRGKPGVRILTSGTSFYGKSNFSPDGNWIAFAHGANRDETNIFKMPVAGGDAVQLTYLKHARATNPAWAPDGQRIAFITNQNGPSKVWTISANGGTAQALECTDASRTHNQLAWWPSLNIVYQQPGNQNFMRVNDKTCEVSPIIPHERENGFISSPVFTLYSGKIAVQWTRDEAGLWIVSTQPYSETLLQSGDLHPFGWSPDANYVYAIRRGREIVKIQVATPGDVTVMATLPGELSNDASLSPDGKAIVVSVSEEKSDAWLMQNFDPM